MINNGESSCVEYRITARIGVLNEFSTGWKKELNVVSWNGGQPKFDIRDWDANHEKMSRGITLHEGEARAMAEMIISWLDGKAPAGGYGNKAAVAEQPAPEDSCELSEEAVEQGAMEEASLEIDEETGEVMN